MSINTNFRGRLRNTSLPVSRSMLRLSAGGKKREIAA